MATPVQDETALLDFTGFRLLMARSGYSFQLTFSNTGEPDMARAWPAGDPHPSTYTPGSRGIVVSDENDPYTALRDLYRKCCEKWPAPSSYDGMSLEDLFNDCLARNWHPAIHDNTGALVPEGWAVFWNDKSDCSARGMTLYAALKEAMTKRLAYQRRSAQTASPPPPVKYHG